jgi:hypothetical protein
MAEQRDLFAKRTGDELRDDGERRAVDHAAPGFVDSGVAVLYAVAQRQELLTTDDVWAGITVATHEHKAISGVMRQGKANGWIVATPDFRATVRPEGHSSPKRVWRSLIWRP